MNQTVIFSIFNKNETYMFSLSLATESLLHSQEAIYGPLCVGGSTELDSPLRVQLNGAIIDVVAEQRRTYTDAKKRDHQRERGVTPLERLGQLLFNMLLPPTLQDALRALPDGQPIILITTDIEIPWELLHDGEQFLALKHPIGRRLWRSGSVRAKEASSDNESWLFISNPTGDLPEADTETEALMDLFEPSGSDDPYPRFLGNKGATRWQVLEAFGMGYEMIHYSGHAEPGKLLLADGDITTVEIQKALQGHPFVFLNACYSAKEMTSQEVDESQVVPYAGLTARNLADAFIMGGAAGFIGTLWPVFDQSSREFADWFYTHLRKGMAVGEALRRTRQQMYKERPDDPIWASFVLYGDPMLKVISAPVESETRRVTVLVARVEGLLPLFDTLNLEEAVQIRDQAIHLLRQVAESIHGHFYAPMSDLLMVHFGVPKAYGNDTEQAIQAALRMSHVLHLFDQQVQKGLGLKVGISTGSVLVRPVSTSSEANYEIVGQVEGVATTLAADAEVNQVVVDAHSQQVARDKFAFEVLPPLAMSAGSRPITRYRVLDKIVHPPLTVIVGREDELNELRKQWRKVKRGRGQVVGIEGDAGVGKTRLVAAFREQLAKAEYHPLWISAICHTYEEKQSYSLLAQVIRHLAGIESHDNEKNQRHKIGQLVLDALPDSTQASQEALKDRVVLLSRVVGLPFEPSAVDNLDPAQRQTILERIVVDILKSKAVSMPIVLMLEDLQWADQASLVVLDQVIRQVRQMPLLLLAVYRSDWQWPHENGRRKRIQTLQLEELEEDERGTLLEHLLGTVPSEELEQVILKQTGGNPFFVKEYVRLLQENGALIRAGDGWVQATDLSQIPHFGKIEQVIQARLDQLTTQSRQVMQKGAVIGVTFEEDVLKAVQDRDANDTLEQDIEALTGRRLIDELGGHPYSYEFYHGLVHESVYKQLPQQRRQTDHKRVANALHELYGNQTDIYRLAHHYYYSHDRVNAIDYCLQVAKQDANKWANQAAVEWYERALHKIESFDEREPSEKEQTNGATPAQIRQWQVEALKGKGQVADLSGQWKVALESYQCAELLTREGGFLPQERADLMRHIGWQYMWGGKLVQALEWMDSGRNLLDPNRDEAERHALGQIDIHSAPVFYQKGEYKQAEVLSLRGLDLLGQEGHFAAKAKGYNLLAIAQDRQGKYQDALIAFQHSIDLWQIASNEYQVKRVENNLAVTYSKMGNWSQASEVYHKVLNFFDKRVKDRNRLAVISTSLGLLEYLQGNYDVSAELQRRAIELADELEIQWVRTPARVNLALVHLAWNQWEQAETLASESIKIETEYKINQSVSEAYRILALIEMGRGQIDEAYHYAQKAVDFACKQKDELEEGAAERVLGQALRLAKDFEVAASHLQRSLNLLEEVGNRFEAARTRSEMAWLSRDMGDEVTALRHTIHALSELVKLGAKGEIKGMKRMGTENKLTFHLQQPLTEVITFCRAEMAAVGWSESSSGQISTVIPTDNNKISLQFIYESHRTLIFLRSESKEVIISLTIE